MIEWFSLILLTGGGIWLCRWLRKNNGLTDYLPNNAKHFILEG